MGGGGQQPSLTRWTEPKNQAKNECTAGYYHISEETYAGVDKQMSEYAFISPAGAVVPHTSDMQCPDGYPADETKDLNNSPNWWSGVPNTFDGD